MVSAVACASKRRPTTIAAVQLASTSVVGQGGAVAVVPVGVDQAAGSVRRQQALVAGTTLPPFVDLVPCAGHLCADSKIVRRSADRGYRPYLWPRAAGGSGSDGRWPPSTTPTGGIVDALVADGRPSMRALAERLHISRAGVYTRVERLERDGVITGYSATSTRDAMASAVGLREPQGRPASWKALQQRVLAIDDVDHARPPVRDDIVLLVDARRRDAAHP